MNKTILTNNTSNNISRDEFKKYASLILLTVQATCFVIVIRYSRTGNSASMYLISTAVVCCEIVKLITCTIILFVQNNYSFENLINQLKSEIVYKPFETLKLLIPSALYTLQNNLYFVALSNLDAVTYQVTYQIKIFVTAMFSVILLGKKLNSMKYLSLFILVIGVAVVQFSKLDSKKASIERSINQSIIGLSAVFVNCLSSGFASVYFEKLLKESKTSIWIRNIQLGLFGVVIALISVYTYDLKIVKEKGFFHGYNSLVCLAIGIQALGGLIVASVIKYADNILKEFAASFSILNTSFVSYFFLKDFVPNSMFVFGASLVIMSTFLYNYEKKPVTNLVIHAKQRQLI